MQMNHPVDDSVALDRLDLAAENTKKISASVQQMLLERCVFGVIM